MVTGSSSYHLLARTRESLAGRATRHAIWPFHGGKRAELTRRPKVFFLDNGLRNAVAGGFAPLDERTDVGKLLENWVFGELHKRFPAPSDIRFWRTTNGAEVDFVLEPRPGRLVAIEVKAYAPDRTLVVHRGEPGEAEIEGCDVRWLPAESLPAALVAPS